MAGRQRSYTTLLRLKTSYLSDISQGLLKRDHNQEKCVDQLDSLLNQLPAYSLAVEGFNQEDEVYSRRREDVLTGIIADDHEALRLAEEREQRGGWINRLRKSWGNHEPVEKLRQRQLEEREGKLTSLVGTGPAAPRPPQGLYIYGSVGSGKTMLMDRFYEAVKESAAVPTQKRVHFNSALLEVHSLMHIYEQEARLAAAEQDNSVHQAKKAKLAVRRFLRQRMKQSVGETAEKLAQTNAAVFARVAARLMGDDSESEPVKMRAGLLCFDEVNINDPFTALALKGIFEALLDSGVIVVATSNRAIWDLNNYGVHEAIFDRLKQRLLEACTPVCLETADFRMLDAGISLGSSYLAPISEENTKLLDELWEAEIAAEGRHISPRRVTVMFGRVLEVKEAAGGVARFTFSELCDAPRGAADYCAIAASFHTVFLTGVPIMSLQSRNLARRFILLLDELYNARTRFFCTAACAPNDLFAGTADDQPVFDMDQLEQLQFESAADGSRLRRDVMQEGGVAPIFQAGTASVTTTHLGGLEEKFAFARAVSRLHEMSRHSGLPMAVASAG